MDLKDQNISTETKNKFQELCQEYDDIVSKNSGDIGKTLLVEMDIDTGRQPTNSTETLLSTTITF